MTRDNKSRRQRHATPNNVRLHRSDEKVCALTSTAFRAALRKERASIREAARWMRVSPSTVQRYMTHGFSLPVLRSRRLGGLFVRALCDQVTIRTRRAA